MFLIYDSIFFIYGLFYLPYLLLTNRWHKDFAQRLGFFPDEVKQRLAAGRNIWIHAVSVGEVLAVEGLISQLKFSFPAYQVVVSVTTKTGYELAQKKLSAHAMVIAAPLDFSFVSTIFLRMIKPKLYVAVETEIWPNLFTTLAKRKVPIVIINGRLSDKSFPRYQRIRFLINNILKKVNLFCMQGQTDADRIIALGALPSAVKVMGSIKFDHLPQGVQASFKDYHLNDGQLWWVCGSTFPGEETIILNVFRNLTKDLPQWRLLIAPRHVERANEVVKLVQANNFNAVKLSELNPTPNEGSVVVVDSVGHLRSLYALASLVFVGKSLCGNGGQNMIEPAFFAKPVIVGPRTENFRDIVASFKSAGAIFEVNGIEAFEKAVKDLMKDEARRRQLGERARVVIHDNQGATKRTLDELSEYLK